MNHDDRLPQDLLWQDDGHVTDVVVDALADGQDEIVPAVAREHVDACDLCARRLGDAVLLAVRVGETLESTMNEAMSTAPIAQPPSWPIPVPAVLGAVLLAALGTIPALEGLPARLLAWAQAIITVVPNLIRAALVLTRTEEVGGQLAMVSMVSVVVLLAGGVLLARAVPRESSLQEGVR